MSADRSGTGLAARVRAAFGAAGHHELFRLDEMPSPGRADVHLRNGLVPSPDLAITVEATPPSS